MIYYHCLDDNTPAGGRRVLYRHVDILNAIGIQACILHQSPGFRLTWFPNETRVTWHADFGPDDVVVLPETRGPEMDKLYPGVRKVIFVQNPYYIWSGYNLSETRLPYDSPDIIGMMVVSEDARKVMERTLPGWALRRGVEITRVHPSLNPVFTYSPDKERVIACMPRKHADELIGILNTLKWRGILNGWQVDFIDGADLPDVARRLQRAAIYLSTGYPEGCPMPPLEAAACGCQVIGYPGRGGDEYWDVIGAVRVSPWDIVGFADALTAYAVAFERGEWGMETLETGSRAARSIYSPDREAEEVTAYWRGILGTTTWDRYNRYWQNVTDGRDIGRVITHMDDETYDDYYRPILRRLEPEKAVNCIYDVGCGAGKLLRVIREFYPSADYYGFDISENMIEAAQAANPGDKFVHLTEFKLPVGGADYLFCHSVFTHVYEQDAGPMLDEIRLALAPKGRASISIHVNSQAGSRGDIGRTDYDPKHFEALLRAHGFRIIDWVEGYLPHGNQRYYGVEAV